MKKWIIKKPDKSIVDKLLKQTDLNRLAAEVLVARNIYEADEVSDFFCVENELSDPFLMADMVEAVDIINDAIEEGKRICIYGDYDCDGITSTVVLYSYLECLGADVTYFIPEREAGYGLNKEAIQMLAENGTDLIITVDNGISAFKEANFIEELGMNLIITDHHQPSEELPTASAIINPHRKDCPSPFKNLCGVGVVLKLIAALDDGNYEAVLEQFADIVAIGTIADIVKLSGENRLIVKKGLELLSNTENIGLSALMNISGVKPENISSTSIAFMIAPRINAAGRFASPMTAVKLLLCEDEQEAEELAKELNSLNASRKECEKKIISEIEEIISKNPEILNQRVLILTGDNWHHGVVGIVSARIQEKFLKPTMIISFEGDEGRASARSIPGFSLFKALSSCSDLLDKFGGHELAAGFSIKRENLEDFKAAIYNYAKEQCDKSPVLTINCEKVLTPQDINIDMISGLSILEPFGEGNSHPNFAMIGAVVQDIVPLKEGKHTKIILNYFGISCTALMFGLPTSEFKLKKGEKGDFVVQLEVSSFAGRTSVNIKIKDYRHHGISQAKYFAAKDVYDKIILKEDVDEKLKARIIPSREELGVIYKKIKELSSESIDHIFCLVNNEAINYCKFRICIDVLAELNLIEIDVLRNKVTIIKGTQKVDLNNSKILMELR